MKFDSSAAHALKMVALYVALVAIATVLAIHIGLAQGWSFFDEDGTGFGLTIQFAAFIAAIFGGGLTYYRTLQTKRANDQRDLKQDDDRFFGILELLASESEINQTIAIDEIAFELAKPNCPATRRRICDNALEAFVTTKSLDLKKLASETPMDLIRSPALFSRAIALYSERFCSDESPQNIGSLYLVGLGPQLDWSNFRVQGGLFRAVAFANCTLRNVTFDNIGLFDTVKFANVTFENCDLRVVNTSLQNDLWRVEMENCNGEITINGIPFSNDLENPLTISPHILFGAKMYRK